MPRYKESERKQIKAETRQLLLKAAIETFAREGYEKANINQISKTAGFAKGTIYNYFDSKRALMLALIHETANVHLEYIAARVLGEDAAERRLMRFFEAGWSVVTEYLPQLRILVHTLYGVDEEFKQVLWQAYQPMHKLIREDILDLGIEQGVFRSLDLNTTTGLIMNLYLGIASHADDDGRIWLDADQIADFVLNALRK
jgi:TetR/AcrR family fatty acid metabolism transcriptional regulator